MDANGIAWAMIVFGFGGSALLNRLNRAMLKKSADLPIQAMTPVQFEHHCADVLRSLGWKCKTTRASGDFGIDLIAEHGGHRVVFQIKKWSKPVNLSAVQEAVAGIAIYGAHSACVISVSGYQQSAFKLAAANKVRLMSYQDLGRFNPPTSQGFLSRLRQKRLPQQS